MRRGRVDEQAAVTDWLKRSAKACRELGTGWAELGEFMVLAGTAGRIDPVRRGSRDGSGRVPLNLDVVEVRDQVAALSARYVGLARGTLRDGGTRLKDDSVHGRLRYLAGVLPRLYDTDPDLTAELVSDVWAGQRRVDQWLVGSDRRVTKPFRLSHACPECGFASLWFDPSTWRIGCGLPDCAHVWAVDQPVLKHTT
jgi:hypothetical protein